MIGVNGSFLTADVTGVQRFAFQLLIGLLEAGPEQPVRVYVLPSKSPEPAVLRTVRKAGAEIVAAPAWARNKQIFEQVALPMMASRDRVSCLVHLSNSLSLLSRRRQVCFLYDLAPIRYANTFRAAYRAKFRSVLVGAKRRRVHIATLSGFSKSELESIGLTDIRIVPAGLGSPTLLNLCNHTGDLGEPASQLKGVPGRFALILGSSDPRKRVTDVVEAWEEPCRELGLPLVVVEGASRLHKGERQAVACSGVIRLEGRVSDGDLVRLITHSSLVVFASAYEGGALAAQEVLALGTPVVASDIPAFRELLPSTVPFFTDTSELTTACRKALLQSPPTPVTPEQAVASWREAAAGLVERIGAAGS